jgi:GWxTD domain-containing protein
MRRMMAKRIYFTCLLLIPVFWAVGCAIQGNVKTDPFYESFYEKTRLIMTEEEIRIYNLLEDKESKEGFIREFWEIRDPDPETEENEARGEFEKRVRFATIRFSWRSARSRPLTVEPAKSDRGWSTDMGRIYIILGPPDLVIFSDDSFLRKEDFEDDFGWRYKHGAGGETWHYDRYRLAISFRGTSFSATAPKDAPRPPDSPEDQGLLQNFPMLVYSSRDLLSVLEFVKLNYINPSFQDDVRRKLRFKANYEDDKIIIRIPAVNTDFKEEEGKLHARFKIKVNVYKDNKKLSALLEEKNVEETEESVMKKMELQLDIPYPLPQKGKYLFDIILEDLSSPIIRKYRNIAKASR